MSGNLRVGLIAPKNTEGEKRWLLSFLDGGGELYARGHLYDVVWFFNLTPEVRLIKKLTDAKVFAVAPEPRRMWPHNYEPELLALCDYYMGYDNFAGRDFKGHFERFFFFAATKDKIEQNFKLGVKAEREYDFCFFARHDPNIRTLIGACLADEKAVLAGPLFNNPQKEKMFIQRRSKYEFITENEINDYYFSEKIAQAMMCGCIPIYYGCRCIKDFVPRGTFVDLGDFLVRGDEKGLEEVIRYCKDPEVYKNLYSNLCKHGLKFLIERASIESCLIEYINRYLEQLKIEGFRARYRNLLGLMGFGRFLKLL